MKFCTCKDTDKILREINRAPGWDVRFTNGTHIRVTAPNGEITFLSSSPSSRSTRFEAARRLKKMGWKP